MFSDTLKKAAPPGDGVLSTRTADSPMVVLTELPLKSFYMFSNKSVKFSIFRIRAETKFIYIDKVFG